MPRGGAGVSGHPKTGIRTEGDLGVHVRNRSRGVCETAGRCNGNGYTVRTNLHSGVSAEPEPKPVLLVILLVMLLVTTGKNRYYW